METVDKLKYNDGEVLKLLWNGTEVSTLRHLGLQKEWSAEEVEPLFNATLYGLDSDGHYHTAQIDPHNCVLSSASTLMIYFQGQNYGDISISNSRIVGWKIDDYSICMANLSGYGGWAGGYSSAVYTANFELIPSKDPSQKVTISVSGKTDENNTLLLRGNLYNKVIRIPSSGYEGKIGILLAPYTFKDNYYFEEPKIQEYIYPNFGNPIYDENHFENDSGINLRIADTDSTIEYTLLYTIQKNNTSNYKEWVVGINLWQTCYLHIIQETKEKNRIYYGRASYPDYDDYFAENQDDPDVYEPYMWNYIFEMSNSKVLNSDFSIENSNDLWYICYPTIFDYEIEAKDDATYSVLKSDYYWGDQSFNILQISNNIGTFNFIKK